MYKPTSELSGFVENQLKTQKLRNLVLLGLDDKPECLSFLSNLLSHRTDSFSSYPIVIACMLCGSYDFKLKNQVKILILDLCQYLNSKKKYAERIWFQKRIDLASHIFCSQFLRDFRLVDNEFHYLGDYKMRVKKTKNSSPVNIPDVSNNFNQPHIGVGKMQKSFKFLSSNLWPESLNFKGSL